MFMLQASVPECLYERRGKSEEKDSACFAPW